ncbi:hypothetical protein CPB85DRAFT_396121 [Mucidula mucida]|nr:hypothetical protein CPB85DRAFT_396121 [Mucidula mucida]
MKTIGQFLKSVVARNPSTFRIFSPMNWFQISWTRSLMTLVITSNGDRVVEILSAHLPSYEAFRGIVHTMMVQYSKFAKKQCFI